MRFAIIGCGLVGRKRADAIHSLGHKVSLVIDTEHARASALAAQFPGARAETEWRAVLDDDIDAAVVATTHDKLAMIAAPLAAAGLHLLVEKPGCRTAAELDAVIAAARKSDVRVKVGFNHRFHPALLKAKALVDQGAVGPLLFVRGRYGHGGRKGYEGEWRAKLELSGGGELIDQGTHLIDLSYWFLGRFSGVHGELHTYFWNMPVEDNAFITLRTERGQTAWLHASWTEWKNLFHLKSTARTASSPLTGSAAATVLKHCAITRCPRI